MIPKGLADADAAAHETWLKLLRSEDASFVRLPRAIRKRENEVAVKEKELCKRKESEALCREQLVKNEKELIRMKIKAERLESEARSGFEASSRPLREEIESVLLSEEKARTENERLKKELEALLEEFKASKSSLEKESRTPKPPRRSRFRERGRQGERVRYVIRFSARDEQRKNSFRSQNKKRQQRRRRQ